MAGSELAAANRALSSWRVEEFVDSFKSEDAAEHLRATSKSSQFQGPKGTSLWKPMLWASLVSRASEAKRVSSEQQHPPESQVVHVQSVGPSGKRLSVSLSSEYRCFQITFKAFMFGQLSLALRCLQSFNRDEKAWAAPCATFIRLWFEEPRIKGKKIPLHSKVFPHFTAHWFHLVSDNLKGHQGLSQISLEPFSLGRESVLLYQIPEEELPVLHLLLLSSPCSLTCFEWPRLQVALGLHLIICSDLTVVMKCFPRSPEVTLLTPSGHRKYDTSPGSMVRDQGGPVITMDTFEGQTAVNNYTRP